MALRQKALARRHVAVLDGPAEETRIEAPRSYAPGELHPDLARIYKPQPGPQTLAHQVPEDVALMYGGARGSAKTYTGLALLADHCLKHGEHARGLVIRREYVTIKDLREVARKFYCEGLGAKWIGAPESAFVFPNGARITLAHCKNREDAGKYQGHQYTFLMIEELTQWASLEPITMLQGSLRSAHGITPRTFMSCNPGGPGHSIIKAEFIDDVEPYKILPVLDEHGEPVLGATGEPARKVFIPGRVSDNPKLLESDPGYVARLKRQAPHLAAAWLEGDWNIAPGAFLEGVWDASVHVKPDFHPAGPPANWPRWCAVDWGWSAPYAALWLARDPDHRIWVYRERYGFGGRPNVGVKKTATELANILHAAEVLEPDDAHRRPDVLDASMWAETGVERGSSIAQSFIDAGRRIQRGPHGGPHRKATLGLVVDLLRERRLFVCEGCKHTIRTVPVIPPDEADPEDIDSDAEDHAFDALKYGVWVWDSRRRVRAPNEPKLPRVAPLPRIEGLLLRPTLSGLVPSMSADDVIEHMRRSGEPTLH